MKRSAVLICVFSSACTVGGPTMECASNDDCGLGGRCDEGACFRPASPPIGSPEVCESEGTPLPGISTADAAAFMIGRWSICRQSGIPLFFNADAEAIELTVDHVWRNLGRYVEAMCVGCDCSITDRLSDGATFYAIYGERNNPETWGNMFDLQLRNPMLSADLAHFSFELFDEIEGTYTFDLHRTVANEVSYTPLCEDQQASCAEGSPRCCWLGWRKPMVCLSCP